MSETTGVPAILNATAAILWPVLAGAVFFSARKNILSLLQRNNITIKAGGLEISAADAAETFKRDIDDLQQKVIAIEGAMKNSPLADGNLRDNHQNDLVKAGAADRTPTKLVSFSLLWVDDHPEGNAFLIERFERDGISVTLAKSTADGVAKFESDEPDLVITDLGRREDGKSLAFAGSDLIRQIRQRNTETPIAVFAGARGIQNQAKLSQIGASLVTDSPIELQSFVRKIRESRQP